MSLELNLIKSMFPYTVRQQEEQQHAASAPQPIALPAAETAPIDPGAQAEQPAIQPMPQVTDQMVEQPMAQPMEQPTNQPEQQASMPPMGAPDRENFRSNITPPPAAPTDEEVALSNNMEQGAAPLTDRSTQQLPSTWNAPGPLSTANARKAAGKTAIERPDFVVPYANPKNMNEQAQNALAMGVYDYLHPHNKDKGVKGRILEILQNFGEGMSRATPGMSAKQALLLGAAGAGVGVANRGWNEEREAEKKLPFLERNAQLAGQQANIQSEINARANDTDTRRRQVDNQIVNAERDDIIGIWEKLPSYKHGDDPNLDKRFDKVGGLPDRTPNEVWQRHQDQNGDVVLFNPKTGEEKPVGNHAKPIEFTEKDLPDEVFGLKSDKDLENAATAVVAKGMPATTFKPEVVASLPASVKNPDGSFNLEKFIAEKSKPISHLEGVELSQLMDKLPDNSQQQVAAQVEKLKKQQDALRREVPIFRGALSGNHPVTDATPVPRSKVIGLFQQIMAIPNAKERAKKLETFYANLSNIRVQ